MTTFTPTTEQQEALRLYLTGDSLAIEAGAGCLAADTIINVNRAGKGKRFTIEQIVRQLAGAPVMTRQLNGKLITQRARKWDLSIPTFVARADHVGVVRLGLLRDAWYSGVKQTYTLTTASGRVIRATSDHPFLRADDRWIRLGDLRIGDAIKVNAGRSTRGKGPDHHRRHASQGATKHVLWQIGTETVVSIEPYGEEATYDIEVDDAPHNFLANGFVVHNTGKTSTLRLLAEATPRLRIQYVAFNRAIVDESRGKFPTNVACNTAHSLAFRTVGVRYKHRLNSPRMKSLDIAARLGIDAPIRLRLADGTDKTLALGYIAGLVMRSIVNFCQSADEQPSEKHVPYITGIDVPPVIDGRRIYDVNNQVAKQVAPYLLRAWADLCDLDGSLPYRHDHYLKQWQLSHPRLGADVILFDESQDANPVMVAVVAEQAQHGTQLVWVGDSQQQIYSFTGAVNALQSIPEASRAFLTQSFRFGPAVAQVANGLLDDLRAELRITGTPQIASTVGPTDREDVLLCRTNAAAVTAFLGALDTGRKAHIVGGSGEVLTFAKAADRLMNTGWCEHPELTCFSSWAEVQEYVAQDEQGGDLRLLVSLIDQFGVDVIIDALERMPREQDADMIISTAHKAKGREWNTVRLASDFPVEPAPEELRLLYVAVTRAKLRLDISAVAYLTGQDAISDAAGLLPDDQLIEADDDVSYLPVSAAATLLGIVRICETRDGTNSDELLRRIQQLATQALTEVSA